MVVRLIQRMICFGALGVIAAVALAWTLALNSSLELHRGVKGVGGGAPIETVVRLNAPAPIVEKYPNASRLIWRGTGCQVTIFYLGGRTSRSYDIGYYHMLLEAGWPLNCVEADTELCDAKQELEPAIVIHEVPLDLGMFMRYQVNRAIPLRPKVMGLCVNSLVYAVSLWGLFRGVGVMRRAVRGRHGRCRGCGYDLTHAEHEVCPECGGVVRGGTRA